MLLRGYGTDEIELQLDESMTDREESLSIPDWKILSVGANLDPFRSDALDREVVGFTLSVEVHRRLEYYL